MTPEQLGEYYQLKFPEQYGGIDAVELGRRGLRKNPEFQVQRPADYDSIMQARRERAIGKENLTAIDEAARTFAGGAEMLGLGIIPQTLQAGALAVRPLAKEIASLGATPEQRAQIEQNYANAPSPYIFYSPEEWNMKYGDLGSGLKTTAKNVLGVGSWLVPGLKGYQAASAALKAAPAATRILGGVALRGVPGGMLAASQEEATPGSVLSGFALSGALGTGASEVGRYGSKLFGRAAGIEDLPKFAERGQLGRVPFSASEEQVRKQLAEATTRISQQQQKLREGVNLGLEAIETSTSPQSRALLQQNVTSESRQAAQKFAQNLRTTPLDSLKGETFETYLTSRNANPASLETVPLKSLKGKTFLETVEAHQNELTKAVQKQQGIVKLGKMDTPTSVANDVETLRSTFPTFSGKLKDEATKAVKENLAASKIPGEVVNELRQLAFNAGASSSKSKASFVENLVRAMMPKGQERAAAQQSYGLYTALREASADPALYAELGRLVRQGTQAQNALRGAQGMTIPTAIEAGLKPAQFALELLNLPSVGLKLGTAIPAGSRADRIQQALTTLLSSEAAKF